MQLLCFTDCNRVKLHNSSLQLPQRSRFPKYMSQQVSSKKETDNILWHSRNQNGAARNSYIYAESDKKKMVKVCKADFIELHGIKASRLKRKVLNFSSDLADHCGKHTNHSKAAVQKIVFASTLYSNVSC